MSKNLPTNAEHILQYKGTTPLELQIFVYN